MAYGVGRFCVLLLLLLLLAEGGSICDVNPTPAALLLPALLELALALELDPYVAGTALLLLLDAPTREDGALETPT